MQISPSSNLSPFVKHYLFLDSKEKRVKNFRLFSDGNTGIVFSLNRNLRTATATLPNAFVYGQLTQFQDLYLTGEESLVIIVFQPAGLYEMIDIPANVLRDKIINTEDLFGRSSLLLREEIFEQISLLKKWDLLNRYFTNCVSGDIRTDDTLVRTSLKFIVQNKGLTSIGQLVKYAGYTERHIERKFHEAIGLSPKRLSSIIKLHYFLGALKTRSGDLTQVVYDAGYFDQSHLIKEFKKHTGMTPRGYLMASEKLTINFVELSWQQ